MTYRHSYQMPEQEWSQVAMDYLAGYTVCQVAGMHLCGSKTVLNILKAMNIQKRTASEALRLASRLGRGPRAKHVPTPEEIEQRAREIREQGFEYEERGVRYGPWSEGDYERRSCLHAIPFVLVEIYPHQRNGCMFLNGDKMR